MTIDDMLSMIPLTGEWRLWKTDLPNNDDRYGFTWMETVGHKQSKTTCFGEYPSEALEKFLREIGEIK